MYFYIFTFDTIITHQNYNQKVAKWHLTYNSTQNFHALT